MTENIEYNEEWYCKNCPINGGNDCGPWQTGNETFNRCKKIHGNHAGWQIYDEEKIQQEKNKTS